MPNWTTELHGAVALLTFTRRPRNLMNFAAATELGDTLESLTLSGILVFG